MKTTNVQSSRLGFGIAAALVACVAACGPFAGSSAPEVAPRAAVTLAERWGIQMESLRLTAAGRMLDLRYRVLDAGKAAPIFERQLKPYLVDQETGAALPVPRPPKTGPLRNSNPPQAGRVYVTLFANAGGVIEPGDRVTFVAGDLRLPDVLVE